MEIIERVFSDENTKKQIFLVPLDLFNGIDLKEIRKSIIETDLIDTVGLLKDGILLILIDKDNNRKGCIKFVNMIDFSSNDDFVANMLVHDCFPDEEFLEFPISEDMIDDFEDMCRNILIKRSIDILENNDISLSPLDYIKPSCPEGFKEETLDVEEFYMPIFNSVNKGHIKGKIVKIYDLKKSDINYTLPIESIDVDEYDGRYCIVKGEALIIAKYGDLRPTYVNTNGATIYVPLNNMWVSLFDAYHNRHLCVDFIIGELYKDYIKVQLNENRESNDDYNSLWDLKFRIPLAKDGKTALELQKQLAEEHLKERKEQLKQEFQLEFLPKYKKIKRNISQLLFQQQNILSILNIVKEQNNGVLYGSEIIDNETEDTVDSYIQKLQEIVDKITNQSNEYINIINT